MRATRSYQNTLIRINLMSRSYFSNKIPKCLSVFSAAVLCSLVVFNVMCSYLPVSCRIAGFYCKRPITPIHHKLIKGICFSATCSVWFAWFTTQSS